MKKTLLSCAAFAAYYPLITLADTPTLEEVFVTASRSETPIRQLGSSVSIINQDEITLAGYPSLVEILRNQAGISVSNSGGQGKATSLSIRGEEGYRTLFIIDGVEASDPTGTQVLTQVQHLSSASDVQRIEILRGPQGFAYGADAGGVVNIFSRSVEEGVAGQISAEGGKYDSSRVSGFVTAGDESKGVFISGLRQLSDGFNARESDETGETDGYENNTVHGKVNAKFNNLKLQLVLRDVSAESEYDVCGSPSTNLCRNEFDQSTARFSLDYTGESSTHAFGISQTQVERKNYAEQTNSFETSGKIRKLDYVGSLDISEQLKIIAGSDYKTESIDGSEDDLERDQLGVFFELQSELSDRFFLAAGGRYDDNEDFGKHSSYRVSSAYIAPIGENTLKLRSSLGTGFRAPSLSEIAHNKGSFAFGEAAQTELREEKSKGADIGIDLYTENGASFELTYFYQIIENEVFFDLVNFSGYLQGSGESKSRGVEFASRIPILSFLDFQGNATYNKTEDDGGAQRSRKPEKQANLGLNLRLLDNALTLRSNYRISRGSVNEIYGIGTVELDDYELLDISANYDLGSGLNFFGRVDNVLNEEYQEVTGFYTSGIAAYAGVRYEF